MSLRAKKENKGFFFSCLGRPECNHAIWLADIIKEIKVLEQDCTKCRNGNKNISIKFKANNFLAMLNTSLINDNDRTYVSCILCDNNLRVILEINDTQLRGGGATSGWTGNQSQANNRTNPSQNTARATNPNARPNASNNVPTNTRPPPPQNRNLPNPNTSRDGGGGGGGDAPKCSMCNGPVTK